MLTKMLDVIRYALYGILIFIFVTLYQSWVKEHPVSATPPPSSSSTIIKTANDYVPPLANDKNSVVSTPQANTELSARLIHIATDMLDVSIDTVGGNITQVKLLKYPEELHSVIPFTLLNNSSDDRYLAQSGLLSSSGPDTTSGQAAYTVDQTQYVLANGENELKVNLHWEDSQGTKITKTFTFHRDSYEVDLTYQVINSAKTPWSGNLYLQLMRKNNPPVNHNGFVSMATYFGAAISSPEKKYQKIPFKEMQKNDLSQSITGGWAAMIQHYFVSAWVPEENKTSQYFSRITSDNLYTIGMIGPKLEVQPGQTFETHAKFYSGPSIAANLEKVSPSLPLTIDYGWFWFISDIIFWMMQHIYNLIGNWGWAIVFVTLIIKLIFYPLSEKSYRSMSGLKKMQPKINALKERFADDKQKFTQATIELYKKEKVNPMSGCLPILVQIPVFIGLYWVLIESVQLRHAPWILWIHDLSVKDPYYVLPILMGISMFCQQRLNPPPPDPMQAKVMMFMPLIFTLMFMNFPAGLMLYWFVNNSLSFLQQWFIMHSINKAEKVKKLQNA
jgi:YidC/Oxa1 family membrane protein insertase